MSRPGFQKLRVYTLAEAIADQLWDVVMCWSPFARGAIGKQLVRCADGIGANIAEGAGRGSYQDNRRFVRIARGSFNETLHILRRAHHRRRITEVQTAALKPLLDESGPKLNTY